MEIYCIHEAITQSHTKPHILKYWYLLHDRSQTSFSLIAKLVLRLRGQTSQTGHTHNGIAVVIGMM